ncbi:hypothetical protein ACP275_02G186400 [Erythranthe tilingii]
MMENDNLRILTEKTWDLHCKINDRISCNQTGFSTTFCSHCSNHGRYCVVMTSADEEMKKMVVLRDSVKDVHTILLFLQRVKSGEKKEREEALGRLEVSRSIVREIINEYYKGRVMNNNNNNNILDEIISFLGDDQNFKFNYILDKKIISEQQQQKKEKNLKGIISDFIMNSVRFGVEFGVMFVCIYTGVKLYENRKLHNHMLERQVVVASDNIQFDVLCGRG